MSADLSTTRSAPPPMPPSELRRIVGHEGTEEFENPSGGLVFGDGIEAAQYRRVIDFGCGCGRVARVLMLQRESPPEAYLGVDLYKPSITWCRRSMTRWDPRYRFVHMNAFNPAFNPRGRQRVAIPTCETFSLANAHSVFTHILQRDVEFYFAECRRTLEPGGVLRSTWFMFDKRFMPMMQPSQQALYINAGDPTNAVVYDYDYVRKLHTDAGLRIYIARAPGIRGFQWEIYARAESGSHVDFPPDDAPLGHKPPPC
jgi:SAM-dependent methyltransferase